MTVRKQKELQKQVEKMEQQVSTFAIKLQEEKDKAQHWMKLYTQIRIERDNLLKMLNTTTEVAVSEEEETEDTTANFQESATNINDEPKEDTMEQESDTSMYDYDGNDLY